METPQTRSELSPPMSSDKSATAALLEPLTTLQTLSSTLFASLSPPQTKPPPAPPVSAFLDADTQLGAAVQLAREHQRKQRRIDALREEILALDARWRAICAALEQGRRELEAIIDEGEERVKAMEQAKECKPSYCYYHSCVHRSWFPLASVPYPQLLAYAQRISAFTSAPPNMPDLAPGQPPPPLFFPPFPNEEKMRRGRLNAEAPLGPLGETHSVGRRTFSGLDPTRHIFTRYSL